MTSSPLWTALRIVATLGLSACHQPQSEPSEPSARIDASQTSEVALLPDDWRNAVVGTWTVRLTIDSLADASRKRLVEGRGTLLFDLDVIALEVREFPAQGLRRSALPSFAPLLGRPLSCTSRDWMMIHVSRVESETDTYRFQFTPQANDCGLSAVVRGSRDSLYGQWVEPGMNFARSRGRLMLLRR